MMKNIAITTILLLFATNGFAGETDSIKSRLKYDVRVYQEDGEPFSYQLTKGYAIVVVEMPNSKNRVKILFDKNAVTQTGYVVKYAVPKEAWSGAPATTEEVKKSPKGGMTNFRKIKTDMNVHQVGDLMGIPTSSDSAVVGGDTILTKYWRSSAGTYIVTFYNQKVYSTQYVSTSY